MFGIQELSLTVVAVAVEVVAPSVAVIEMVALVSVLRLSASSRLSARDHDLSYGKDRRGRRG